MARIIESGDIAPKKKRKVRKKSTKRDIAKRKARKKAAEEIVEDVISDDHLIEDQSATEAAFEQALEVVERMPSLFEQENEQISEYRRMFNKLKKMIRMSEGQYLKSKQSRDMYAVLKAYDQMRELIADLRALADYTQYVDSIQKDVVDPFAQSAAAALIEFYKSAEKIMQQSLSPADFRLAQNKLKSIAAESGNKIQQSKTASDSAVQTMFAPK